MYLLHPSSSRNVHNTINFFLQEPVVGAMTKPDFVKFEKFTPRRKEMRRKDTRTMEKKRKEKERSKKIDKR